MFLISPGFGNLAHEDASTEKIRADLLMDIGFQPAQVQYSQAGAGGVWGYILFVVFVVPSAFNSM